MDEYTFHDMKLTWLNGGSQFFRWGDDVWRCSKSSLVKAV